MTVTSRDLKAPESDAESRKDRRRATRRRRLELFFQGLSVLLAVIGALVLLFVGGLLAQQGVVEDFVAPIVAELPSPPEEEASPGFDAGALEDRLREIAEGHGGVYGIAVLEPDSGTRVSLRGDEEFVAASIGKLPPFAALYRAAARGDLDLEEQISLRRDDIQDYGSGSLHYFPAGYSLTLRDSAYYLVNHSDNTAWVMLDRRLGEENITAELEDMGIQNSRYGGHFDGYYTTPDDVLLLLENISDPDFTSEELSAEMLDDMTDTLFEDRIPEKLPSNVRVAHKIGSYGYNFGDVGLVSYKDEQGVERHYYLVVLSEGAGEYEARDAMQEISLAVYEALTGTTVDPEWSRSGETESESTAEAPLATPPPAPAPSPPPTAPPAEKSGGGRVGNTEPAAKAPPQEKAAPKVQTQPPATRYDASSYTQPDYTPYYAQESQEPEYYYYYETDPEESYYSEQY